MPVRWTTTIHSILQQMRERSSESRLRLTYKKNVLGDQRRSTVISDEMLRITKSIQPIRLAPHAFCLGFKMAKWTAEPCRNGSYVLFDPLPK
jgi:hypothetical protein